MKEERMRNAVCLTAIAILEEVKNPKGWKRIIMWFTIGEEYVQAFSLSEKRLFEALLEKEIEQLEKQKNKKISFVSDK